MARLTDSDREAFRELTQRGWIEEDALRSPRYVEPTPENLVRYCAWLDETSRFFIANKSIDFSGDHWKL